jgi:GT2 family glycosyltransferase
MSIKFRFVCASRLGREEFFEKTAPGRSLLLYRAPFIDLVLFENNRSGLPALYNEAVRRAERDPAVLIFCHDDVHLCDFFWPLHLVNGLREFDIIGLAGNQRRLPGQPAWCFVDRSLAWDESGNLSGTVGHGGGFPPKKLSRFGPPGKLVKLLDGFFLAMRSETLLSRQIRFDEDFTFHFYDMDFCRQAEASGLRMGTWTISAAHESPGGYGEAAWQLEYEKYLEKWKA